MLGESAVVGPGLVDDGIDCTNGFVAGLCVSWAMPEHVFDSVPLSTKVALVGVDQSRSMEPILGADGIGLDGAECVIPFGMVFFVVRGVEAGSCGHVDKDRGIVHVFTLWPVTRTALLKVAHKVSSDPIANVGAQDAGLRCEEVCFAFVLVYDNECAMLAQDKVEIQDVQNLKENVGGAVGNCR